MVLVWLEGIGERKKPLEKMFFIRGPEIGC